MVICTSGEAQWVWAHEQSCVPPPSSLPATSRLWWITVEACRATGPSSSTRYSLLRTQPPAPAPLPRSCVNHHPILSALGIFRASKGESLSPWCMKQAA